MEIHMDPEVPFETLLEHMRDRFQNSARFFRARRWLSLSMDAV